MYGVSLTSHLEQVETFIHGRLEGMPSDCLRFRHNQTLFFLLTLLCDSVWHYRVREFHPKNRLFNFIRRCCLCDWEPMGSDLEELVDHLINVGPNDQPSTPNNEDKTPPPPVEEDTKDEESVGENRLIDEELREEHIKEEEPLDEKDPKEDPMEEEDPKEEPKEESLEEDDP